jgi:TetR/AcrR family transcriptional regulator, transcriptional repressor for nem operon
MDWVASRTHQPNCGLSPASFTLSRRRVRRAAYERKMLELVRKMSNVLDGAGPDREKRAWSVIAMMVGAIAISRAMPDGEEADQVLDSALRTAIALIAPK